MSSRRLGYKQRLTNHSFFPSYGASFGSVVMDAFMYANSLVSVPFTILDQQRNLPERNRNSLFTFFPPLVRPTPSPRSDVANGEKSMSSNTPQPYESNSVSSPGTSDLKTSSTPRPPAISSSSAGGDASIDSASHAAAQSTQEQSKPEESESTHAHSAKEKPAHEVGAASGKSITTHGALSFVLANKIADRRR